MPDAARESIQVFHRDVHGIPDYSIALTCTYSLEAGQWVGICDELGTPSFADTLEQARAELQEAVQLQLNEVESLTNVLEYLEANGVPISRVSYAENTGFAVAAGSRLEYIGT